VVERYYKRRIRKYVLIAYRSSPYTVEMYNTSLCVRDAVSDLTRYQPIANCKNKLSFQKARSSVMAFGAPALLGRCSTTSCSSLVYCNVVCGVVKLLSWALYSRRPNNKMNE
jgi:hypothetical protein